MSKAKGETVGEVTSKGRSKGKSAPSPAPPSLSPPSLFIEPAASLYELDLGRTGVGARGAAALAEAMGGFGAHACHAPKAPAAPTAVGATVATASGTTASHKFETPPCPVLAPSPLTVLYLGGNSVGDRGAAALACALKRPGTRLQYAGMFNATLPGIATWHRDDLGDDADMAWTTLPCSPRRRVELVKLDLGRNVIGDVGG
jgi:hypothetical protein